MGATFFMLTATWLAGQNVDSGMGLHDGIVAPGCPCQGETGGFLQRLRPGRLFGCQGDRPGLFQRLHGRFKELCSGFSDADDQGLACMGGCSSSPGIGIAPKLPLAAAKTNEPPMADVARRPLPKAPIAPTGFKAPLADPKPLNPKMADKVGHETDYSWVTGQVSQENGQWVIRYATPETVDRFGGKFILAPGTDMSRFRDGDLISVHGQPAGGTAGNALYRASSVDLIEHDN